MTAVGGGIIYSMNLKTNRGLTVIDSVVGQPRTYPLDTSAATQEAAVRRLATFILGLDVATLAQQLRAERLAASVETPRAA